MSDEIKPEFEEMSLAHVAALSLATWIYLISKDDDAIETIGKTAEKLYTEMVSEKKDEQSEEG